MSFSGKMHDGFLLSDRMKLYEQFPVRNNKKQTFVDWSAEPRKNQRGLVPGNPRTGAVRPRWRVHDSRESQNKHGFVGYDLALLEDPSQEEYGNAPKLQQGPSFGAHTARRLKLPPRARRRRERAERAATEDVDQWMADKFAELHEMYRNKMEAAARDGRKAQQAVSWAHKAELARVVKNYQLKFQEILYLFQQVSTKRRAIRELKEEVVHIQQECTFGMQTYKEALCDEELEKKLRKNSDILLSPSQALRTVIAERKQAIASLSNNLEELSVQIADVRADGEDRVRQEMGKRKAAVQYLGDDEHEMVNDISEAASRERALQLERRTLVAAVKHQTQTCENLRKLLAEKLEAVQKRRQRLLHSQLKYQNEIAVGLAAHRELVSDLNMRAQSLIQKLTATKDTMHYLTTLQDSCLQDLICPHCISVFVDPVLCWPCGHSCCARCVKFVRASDIRSDGGSKKVLVCPECKSERDTLLVSGRKRDSSERVARPTNPLVDEVEGFGEYAKQRNGVLGNVVTVFSQFLTQLRGIYKDYSDTVGGLALHYTEEEILQRLTSPLKGEEEDAFAETYKALGDIARQRKAETQGASETADVGLEEKLAIYSDVTSAKMWASVGAELLESLEFLLASSSRAVHSEAPAKEAK